MGGRLITSFDFWTECREFETCYVNVIKADMKRYKLYYGRQPPYFFVSNLYLETGYWLGVCHALMAQRLARSLRKWKVPGSNPTVGKNFSFCNSRFALLTGRISPCK